MNQENKYPLVSVIIPCRNEEKFIGATLQNILEQDYPKDCLEVFVVDGQSTDRTKKIVLELSQKHTFIQVLDNPDRIVPPALNLAIKKSKGDVIIRMDAHSEYPTNYISELVKHLYDLNADNVGGAWITEPGASTLEAEAIALATSHPFGIGNAQYRLGGTSPILVDTVPFGCYRKEVFERIGLFDIDLVRNQDDEFNGRLIKNGGKIFLIPEIKIKYYARESLKKTAKMFYQYGLFKPLVNIKLGFPATFRQLIPPAFVMTIMLLLILSTFNSLAVIALPFLLSLYAIGDLLISFKIASRNKVSLLLYLLLVFPVIHFSYGYGYLAGIVQFSILRKHKKSGLNTIAPNR